MLDWNAYIRKYHKQQHDKDGEYWHKRYEKYKKNWRSYYLRNRDTILVKMKLKRMEKKGEC